MTFTDNCVINVIKKSIIVSIALFVLCLYADKIAMAQKVEEYAVKAAFVYNFARFIQWPESAFACETDQFQICYIGNEKVAKQLNSINGKKKDERTISVKHFSSVKGCEGCNIIFISRNSGTLFLKKIISLTKEKPVLTIGESKGFTQLGGVINFTPKKGRLLFEININAAKKKLKPSSRLLKLAIIMDDKK